MAAEARDHLAAEPLILAHLREALGDAVRDVAAAADLAGVTEAQQISPAVHVLYMGDDVPTNDGARSDSGATQKTRQRWMTVVAVRNARSQTGGSAVREDAGPLISRVIEAMAGWAPNEALKAFKRVPAPPAAYTGTFGYFPLQWITEFYS